MKWIVILIGSFFTVFINCMLFESPEQQREYEQIMGELSGYINHTPELELLYPEISDIESMNASQKTEDSAALQWTSFEMDRTMEGEDESVYYEEPYNEMSTGSVENYSENIDVDAQVINAQQDEEMFIIPNSEDVRYQCKLCGRVNKFINQHLYKYHYICRCGRQWKSKSTVLRCKNSHKYKILGFHATSKYFTAIKD